MCAVGDAKDRVGVLVGGLTPGTFRPRALILVKSAGQVLPVWSPPREEP